MTNKFKTIEINEEIFRSQFNNCDCYDDDCLCFGMNIDGKFYLYSKGDIESYWLNVFDMPLYELLCDSEFVSTLATEEIRNNKSMFCEFCGFIADCMNGNFVIENRPFELHDIVYAFCYKHY